jgi:hypothetical protein
MESPHWLFGDEPQDETSEKERRKKSEELCWQEELKQREMTKQHIQSIRK